MSAVRELRGGCACGRNEFVVLVPSTSVHEIQVFLDNSSRTRRHTSSPFTPFLRVPLDWYHSATYAFFPDETHRSIRRTFSSPQPGPQTQRHFCGFCGTPLTCWNEQTADDARHIEINLGSLVDEDIHRLQGWSLLRTEEDEEPYEYGEEDAEAQMAEMGRAPVRPPVRGMLNRGVPWFEDMIENSALGRVRRQKGGYQAPGESVYWEIVELAPDGTEVSVEETSTPGKRKRGEGEEDAGFEEVGDVHMRG